MRLLVGAQVNEDMGTGLSQYPEIAASKKSCWDLDTDLWQWLANIDIYSDWLKEN